MSIMTTPQNTLISPAARCCSALLLMLITGCSTMAPKYTRPAAPVPPLVAPSRGGEEPSQHAAIPWQEFFVQPQLRAVIEQALKNNRDLRVAALTIERFRALYQIRSADQLPKIEAAASASYQRIPETLSASGKAMTTDQYSLSVGLVSYELDLFGRVQSLKDLALEQYLGTEQARRGVQLALVSQVAAAWLNLGADRERLQLAKDTLANQQESHKLITSRFAAGVATALALNQARSSVEAARVEVARASSLVAQDINALNFAVGTPVGGELLPHQLVETATVLKDVTPGLSSEVLLQRPDIIQAENQLKGLNANIGAAQAAFFPRISLVSSVGIGSNELSSLFKGDPFAWSILPRITLPIFDGGTNKANLKVAEVDRDIAVAQYEKAIQGAFREVADVLAQKETYTEQLAAQQALTTATAESYRLAQLRYDSGVDSYLQVLDAQRSLYAAQQGLIATRLSRLTNQVTLFKALGGGS